MAIFEVTAHGFDGGSDLTDDRVFWVEAPNKQVVLDLLVDTGAEYWGEIIEALGDQDLIDFRLPAETAIFVLKLMKYKQGSN